MKTEIKSEAKSATAMKTEMKSEAKAKMANAANTKSEMESLIESGNTMLSTMENSSETKTETALYRGWVMIKGRGNLCIKYAGGRRHIRQGRCNRSMEPISMLGTERMEPTKDGVFHILEEEDI
jgi:hypothetical protein